MKTATVTDSISGAKLTIENPLRAKDIVVGQLIWYEGYNSVGAWSCPAKIIRVDAEKRTFRVLAFDDMQEGESDYPFDLKDAPLNRRIMRLVGKEYVAEYVRRRRNVLQREAEDALRQLGEHRRALTHFDIERAKHQF